MWLGVPYGTDEYVDNELRRQIEEHDVRLRGIAAFAGCDGPAVSHGGVRLSRQIATKLVQFSANARDVHFLRSLGRRAVGAAAALHDHAVDGAPACVLGQAAVPDVGDPPLCYRPADAWTQSFAASKDWLRPVGGRAWQTLGRALGHGRPSRRQRINTWLRFVVVRSRTSQLW
eukprot:SAG22_NODE_733_length_7580_cov_2.329501_2_plen_173_part_00